MEPLEPIPVPCAQRGRFQSFFRFTSTFKIFNNLWNLLFAQRQPKSAQYEGVLSRFCHGGARAKSARPERPEGVGVPRSVVR